MISRGLRLLFQGRDALVLVEICRVEKIFEALVSIDGRPLRQTDRLSIALLRRWSFVGQDGVMRPELIRCLLRSSHLVLVHKADTQHVLVHRQTLLPSRVASVCSRHRAEERRIRLSLNVSMF